MKPDVDIVCFADVHADEISPEYTDILEDGLPYHLVSARDSINHVGQYARGLGPDTVIMFAGDMFHHKYHASTVAQHLMGEAWRGLDDFKYRLGITGNHDMLGSRNLMRGWADVYGEAATKRFDSLGLAVCLAPYCKGPEWLESVSTGLRKAVTTGLRPVVLGHQALMGSNAPAGAGKFIRLQGGVDLEAVAGKAVFMMGDIHEGQQLDHYGNCFYAGGLLQRSLSDRGRRPCFLHLRLGKKNLSCEANWIVNPHSPLFISSSVTSHGELERTVRDVGALKNRTTGGVVFITLNYAKEFEKGLRDLMVQVMTWKDSRVALRLRPARKTLAMIGGTTTVQPGSDLASIVSGVTTRMGAPRGTRSLVMELLEASRSQLDMSAREEVPHFGDEESL